MRILGLIPAREGSKGIPGKNIRTLGHQPLIAFTIKDGLAAKKIDMLAVTTDGKEIAEVAGRYGAEVPFIRPKELAQDHTPSIEVVLHAIDFFEQKGDFFDAVCLLQPTSPFKPKGFIDDCVQKFLETDADSLISVLEVPHEYNPHWTFEMEPGGNLSIATGEQTLIPRRQELPMAYHRDGSVYISRVSLIKEKKVLVGGKTVGVLSNKSYYANLDTMDDWQKAEVTYSILFSCVE
ncbi:cytidylyltransferase domain-containing protein [Algoriphagus terrigena]|uniref:acylneuraminate cytidylyltransferase family protein n=1 Tax=Algoriphagus terrigena TaxID=344884 RepID=UPI000479192B|nr:acylneuraminate cytidylyltransferase family protein [Algoriphagus terrigena]